MNSSPQQNKAYVSPQRTEAIANKYNLLAQRCSDAELSEKCRQIANHLYQTKQGSI